MIVHEYVICVCPAPSDKSIQLGFLSKVTGGGLMHKAEAKVRAGDLHLFRSYFLPKPCAIALQISHTY